MAGAAYQANTSCTDDETFILHCQLIGADGDPFPVAEYAFEYSLRGCGADMLLTEGEGITIEAPTASITITPGVDCRLKVGTYQHGFRKRDLATDQVDQLFDGTVTVTQGNFNGN